MIFEEEEMNEIVEFVEFDEMDEEEMDEIEGGATRSSGSWSNVSTGVNPKDFKNVANYTGTEGGYQHKFTCPWSVDGYYIDYTKSTSGAFSMSCSRSGKTVTMKRSTGGLGKGAIYAYNKSKKQKVHCVITFK